MSRQVAVFLLFGLLCAGVYSLGDAPALLLDVQDSLINTAINTILAEKLANESHVDNITTQVKKYTVNISNITIKPMTFTKQKTGVNFNEGKSQMTLNIEDLKGEIISKFSVKGGSIIDLDGDLKVQIGTSAGIDIFFDKPDVSVGMDFDKFEIEITGSKTASFITFLTKLLGPLVKSQVRKALESSVQSVFDTLYSSPLITNITLPANSSYLMTKELSLGVNLTIAKAFGVSGKFLSASSVAFAFNPSSGKTSPDAPTHLPSYGLAKDANFGVVMSQNVLNSLLWTINNQNFLQLRFNNSVLNKSVLSTQTFRFIFPELYAKYPKNNVTLDVSNTAKNPAPKISFPTKAPLSLQIQLETTIHADLGGHLEEAFTFQVDVEANLTTVLKSDNITVNLSSISFSNTKVVRNPLHIPDERVVGFVQLLNNSIRNIVTIANQFLATNPIPIKGIKNAELQISDYAMILSGQLQLNASELQTMLFGARREVEMSIIDQ